MSTSVENAPINSATEEMKDKSRYLARIVGIGVIAGLISGFLVAIWIAGSQWTGTMIATSLSVMGAAATIGGLLAANFAPE